MLRVYDKQLEQKQKVLRLSDAVSEYIPVDDIPDAWIRWELELKNELADMTVDLLISMEQIAPLSG